jgi:hypothetical protein
MGEKGKTFPVPHAGNGSKVVLSIIVIFRVLCIL